MRERLQHILWNVWLTEHFWQRRKPWFKEFISVGRKKIYGRWSVIIDILGCRGAHHHSPICRSQAIVQHNVTQQNQNFCTNFLGKFALLVQWHHLLQQVFHTDIRIDPSLTVVNQNDTNDFDQRHGNLLRLIVELLNVVWNIVYPIWVMSKCYTIENESRILTHQEPDDTLGGFVFCFRQIRIQTTEDVRNVKILQQTAWSTRFVDILFGWSSFRFPFAAWMKNYWRFINLLSHMYGGDIVIPLNPSPCKYGKPSRNCVQNSLLYVIRNQSIKSWLFTSSSQYVISSCNFSIISSVVFNVKAASFDMCMSSLAIFSLCRSLSAAGRTSIHVS